MSGLSVLIPERGRPDLLAGTLAAAQAALSAVALPSELRVLVNGAPASDYAALQAQFPQVHWAFVGHALGFHGAVQLLLQAAAHPWVYLLNSDMRLHSDALAQLLPLRAPGVFAIASQIRFADSHRRREETGYTLPVLNADGQLELHDLLPPDETPRLHVYAGGGASLFLREPLQRYLRLSQAYAPFYFEDADWGMQAWAEGYRVLYCPRSQAVHEHRATIARYHSEAEIQAVIVRNLAHFRWRYGDLFGAPRHGPGLREQAASLLRSADREHRQARLAVLRGAQAGRLRELPQPQRVPTRQAALASGPVISH